jgi:hypothetical protein
MFKVSDEEIMSLVRESLNKEVKDRGLIKEEAEGGKVQIDTGCDKIPAYPALSLNKLVGKKQPTDVDARQFRGILERVGVSVEGSDVASRIQSLNKIINDTLQSDMEGIALDQMVSRFVFLDSFLTLLDRASYEPQMAGLLLEPLIAAALKGQQKGGTQVISDFEVAGPDIDAGISLKLKSDNLVTGSMILFIKGLLLHGEIGFYHVRKLRQPKSDVVDAISMTYHSVQRPPELVTYFIGLIKEIRTRDLVVTDKMDGIDNTDEIKRIFAEVDNLFPTPEALASSEYIDPQGDFKREIETKVAKKFFSDISQRTPKGLTTVHFSTLDVGTDLGVIRLPSTKELRLSAAKAINKLNDDVAGLYKSIGLLSCIMKNYTSSVDIGRDVFAEKASEYATDILNTAQKISSPKQK